MKKLILLSFTLIISTAIYAQSINYKVVRDDVSINNWLSLNVDLIGMEVALPNLSAIDATSFNLGVWGHVEPGIPVGIQYSYQRSWFVLGSISNKQIPKNNDLQLGAYFFLSDKTKRKKMKVGLKSEVQDNYATNTRTTTNTYINVEGNVRNQMGFRGGLLYKSNAFILDEDADPAPTIEAATLNSVGTYAGLMLRHTSNLVLDTDKYGLVRTASKANNIFLDVLITPSNTFRDFNNGNADVTSQVKSQVTSFPLGVRIGFQTYQIEKKTYTGKKFGMSARGEIGFKPYLGPYISTSFGMTILKLQK